MLSTILLIATGFILFVGFPIIIILTADSKTKDQCEHWVQEMKLLRDDDYRNALKVLDKEFPGVKEE